jgi:hypothetical protein
VERCSLPDKKVHSPSHHGGKLRGGFLICIKLSNCEQFSTETRSVVDHQQSLFNVCDPLKQFAQAIKDFLPNFCA